MIKLKVPSVKNAESCILSEDHFDPVLESLAARNLAMAELKNLLSERELWIRLA